MLRSFTDPIPSVVADESELKCMFTDDNCTFDNYKFIKNSQNFII